MTFKDFIYYFEDELKEIEYDLCPTEKQKKRVIWGIEKEFEVISNVLDYNEIIALWTELLDKEYIEGNNNKTSTSKEILAYINKKVENRSKEKREVTIDSEDAYNHVENIYNGKDDSKLYTLKKNRY